MFRLPVTHEPSPDASASAPPYGGATGGAAGGCRHAVSSVGRPGSQALPLPPRRRRAAGQQAGRIRRLDDLPGMPRGHLQRLPEESSRRGGKPTRSAAGRPKPANPATARAASTRNRRRRRTSATRPSCKPGGSRRDLPDLPSQPAHPHRPHQQQPRQEPGELRGLPLHPQERAERPGGAQDRPTSTQLCAGVPHRRLGELPAAVQAPAAGRRHVVRGLPQSARQRPAAKSIQTRRCQRAGLLQMPRRQARAVHLRARPGAAGRLRGLPQAARLAQSADADARAKCASSAWSATPTCRRPTPPANGDPGHGAAGVPRSAQPAVPELHPLPPEGAWLLREPGLIQMRFLLALMLLVPVLAQQPAPQAKPEEKAQPAAKPDQKPADQQPAPAAGGRSAAAQRRRRPPPTSGSPAVSISAIAG